MKNEIVGAILSSAAGLVLTLGTIGAQIAYGVAQAGFRAGRIGGVVPPGPQDAYPHWLVVVATLVLGGIGLFLLVGCLADRHKD